MASSLIETSSPTHIEKLQDPPLSTKSSPSLTPASEKQFWSTLRNRIDSLLMDRKRKSPSIHSFPNLDLPQDDPTGVGAFECGKPFKEDSLLLLRGLDSIAFSLSQLTDNLDVALQGATDLAKPTLSELFNRESETAEHEENQPRAKRKCDWDNTEVLQIENKEKSDSQPGPEKMEKLEKARNLAVSMATKAASLARELKSVKSDLCFTQERCTLLEEENRRLRDGFVKGMRPEEDDLVRLQLEALLAEKSRLANLNANLTRENQCLHQLVEYHQLTLQDLSASPDDHGLMGGLCLDFSSPPTLRINSEVGEEGLEAPETPRVDGFVGFSSFDDCYEEQ